MNKIRLLGIAGPLCAALAGPAAVSAQGWPAKPVRVVVPFGTGGGGTIQARLITDSLRQTMGATFVIDNRPGAGGLIGAQMVAESPPDGYTLLFTTSTLAVNTTLFADTLKFDPRKDLAPVSLVSAGPLVLCVHPSVPARSVKELIALAKKHPGRPASSLQGRRSRDARPDDRRCGAAVRCGTGRHGAIAGEPDSGAGRDHAQSVSCIP
ncbi:MAG: tripartite tricarboxylate transporter substrate-binding protein [Proteobacteria bacterium]|nr:tripartite tricarboxylate transporter substrate-binding protein [Pseudomonadota bacterium]